MTSVVNNFRKYTKKCRPVWTLTWRECVTPSVRSGIQPVREEDISFNKKLAEKYIKEYGASDLLDVIKYLKTHPEIYIRYSARTSRGYCHRIVTPEWQAMGYFLAVLNAVIRDKNWMIDK